MKMIVMTLVAVLVLALALTMGGCASLIAYCDRNPECARAQWETVLPGSTEPQPVIETPPVPWPPQEHRNGSTRGSWTGVCDPKCPVKP